MYGANSIKTLPIQTHLTETEKQHWTHYNASIALAASGRLLFVLLGFFLLAIFTIFEGNSTALNYAGVASLIIGFMFFGFSAHFMDKRDNSERQSKRAEFDNLTKNNFFYESVTFSDTQSTKSGKTDRF